MRTDKTEILAQRIYGQCTEVFGGVQYISEAVPLKTRRAGQGNKTSVFDVRN